MTGTTYTHIAGGNWTEGHVILDGADAVYETPYRRIRHNSTDSEVVKIKVVVTANGSVSAVGLDEKAVAKPKNVSATNANK